MYQFEINENEAGQRFDKYLHKLLPKAPASFFYKMLRKKNIVLNGKKAEGKEKLVQGDKVSLFLAEETFQNFLSGGKESEYQKAYEKLKGICVLYENEHMLLLHKPAGILSQKASDTDFSVNEWLIGYLLASKAVTSESLSTYKPSICNRLDRNTSGIVVCAKSLLGSQELNRLIAARQIRKFYRLFVKGTVEEEVVLDGYLAKDTAKNQVRIFLNEQEAASHIQTRYYPVKKLSDMTYLEIELITGKTHQIRAHMASVGHPLLGDYKYGNKAFNDKYQKKYGIKSQLLHAYRLEFPPNPLLFSKEDGTPDSADGIRVFTADEPEVFQTLLQR